jgi:hypothetical protein
MTATAKRARAFVATIVPETVEHRSGQNGAYVVMPNAVVLREGREDMVRTVMAFGRQNEQIAHLLQEGRAIDLAVRFDGGTMRVVGLPHRPEAASELLVAHVPGTPYAETVVKTLYGVLAASGVDDRDLAGQIIVQMLTGESDGPSDDETPYDPDTIEQHGHLLLPLVDAGIDHAEALEIAARIVSLPISAYLDDMALMRRQNVAREFVARAA